MTPSTEHSSELFLRFTRQRLIALLVIVILLGAAALAVMLSPHAIWQRASYASLVAVAIAMLVAIHISLQSRRWAPDAPEVRVAIEDEWRHVNMHRASRAALIVVLIAQYPLVLLFGFLMELPAPRGAFAMAASTITLGLVTLIALFLFLDRE